MEINFLAGGLANLEGVLPLMIPIIALMIPIVAVLTKHQQRMAEIIHNNQGQNQLVGEEVAAIQKEIRELKALIHQQAIAIDNVATPRMSAPPAPESIQERLSN